MTNKKFILIIFVTTFALTQAYSQKLTLTLDQALKVAVENNRELKSAHMDMEKSDYRVQEAIGTALPTITAIGQYSRAIKKPVFFLPGFFMDSKAPPDKIIAVEIGADNSLQFGFQATQILFNSAVFTGVGTAKIYQQASRDVYRSAYNTTIANVKRAFYGVLFTQHVYEMTKASLQNAEENLKSVGIRNKQGIVSDYDLIRAQVQTENVRPSVIDAERNVLVATNGLKMVLGVDPQQEVKIVGDFDYQPVDPSLVSSAEQVAIENNAQLKALEHQTKVSEEIISINRSEYLPTLSAFGNYMWQAQKNSFNISSNDLVRSSQVGLNLSFNLFNGMQTTARVNQAQIDFHKSQEQLQTVKYALQTNIQSIRLRLESAQKRIDAQARTVEQAEKGYKIATTRYNTGSGTQLEVNDADLALMRARVNKIQAMYDYAVARVDLEETLSIQNPQ